MKKSKKKAKLSGWRALSTMRQRHGSLDGDTRVSRASLGGADDDDEPEAPRAGVFTIRMLWEWVFVPTGDTFCPPSKASLARLLQRLDFNAYNPIQEFDGLYKKYYTFMGVILTLFAALVFGGYAYFTIVDQLADFQNFKMDLNALDPGRSARVGPESIFFWFQDASGNVILDTANGGSSLTIDWSACSRNATQRNITCNSIGGMACTLTDNGIQRQANCPNTTAILRGHQHQGASEFHFVLLTVTTLDPSALPGAGAAFVHVVKAPGDSALRDGQGISFAGVKRVRASFINGTVKTMLIETEPVHLRFNRKYRAGLDDFTVVSNRPDTSIAYQDVGRFSIEGLVSPTVPNLNSGLVHTALYTLSPVEIDLTYQKTSMYDALAKIGGASVMLIVCLSLYGRFCTKLLFRRARAWEPDPAAFRRLLRKKQTELKQFRAQLHDMKRPLEEMGLRYEGDGSVYLKKRMDATKVLGEYLSHKEANEMAVFQSSVRKGLLMSLDEYQDPLKDLDLNDYYGKTGHSLRKAGLSRESHGGEPTTHGHDQRRLVAASLNMIALQDVRTQMRLLLEFLESVHRDLQKEVAHADRGRHRDVQ